MSGERIRHEVVHQVRLEHLVNRYKMHNELLTKHPENKEMLERKIRETEHDIAEYVSTPRFREALNAFSL